MFQLARFRVVGDRAAERALLMIGIAPASAHPAAVLRFGPDGALYAALNDGGDPGLRQSRVLERQAAEANCRGNHATQSAGASPVFATNLTRPRGLGWDAIGRILVAEPDELSILVPDDDRAVEVDRRRLAPGAQTAGLVVYRSARVPQLQDDLLMGSPDGLGLVRVRAERGREGGPDQTLLRGIVTGVRCLAVAADGTIYLVTADRLIRITPSP